MAGSIWTSTGGREWASITIISPSAKRVLNRFAKSISLSPAHSGNEHFAVLFCHLRLMAGRSWRQHLVLGHVRKEQEQVARRLHPFFIRPTLASSSATPQPADEPRLGLGMLAAVAPLSSSGTCGIVRISSLPFAYGRLSRHPESVRRQIAFVSPCNYCCR